MLMCLNQHRAAMAKCMVKAVMRLKFLVIFTPEYVSGWCGLGFDSYSQPFLLTYLKADFS